MSNSTQGNKTIPQLNNGNQSAAINPGMLFHCWDPTQPLGVKDVPFPVALLQSAAVQNYFPPNGPQTTVSAFLNQFLQYHSGQFYQNAGARVNRINDRVLIGGATDNNATNVANQPDWMTQYQLAKGRTYGFMQVSTLGILNGSAAQDSLQPVVIGAQNSGRHNGGVIGLTVLGINNDTSAGSQGSSWAAYYEAYRDCGTNGNGGTYGLEIDTINYVSDIPIDPYQQSGDQTIALQLASGGEYPPSGQFPGTAAINIQNNHSTFDAGIIFGSNSLTGSTGSSGSAIAIALGFGHILQWYGGAGIATSSINCNGTTHANGVNQLFSENLCQFNNASGNQIFGALGVASGVNGITALGAATTNPPQLVATGSDTNIDLQLTPKGTGQVRAASTINPVGGILGVSTNSNATAGNVGEYNQQTATGVSLTTGTPANITSVSLAAGDYEVWGTVSFVGGTGCIPTSLQCGANTTSATFGGNGTSSLLQLTFGTASSNIIPVPRQRFSFASTTTVFMVGSAIFSGGTMSANTALNWRRIR